MKTRIRVVVVLLVAVAATTWWVRQSRPAGSGALFASGTVEATDADLGFQRPGRIAAISVVEGDRVLSGTPLARLDAQELEATVRASNAMLAAAEARLSELGVGSRSQDIATAVAGLRAAVDRVEEATRDAERTRTLHEGGAISLQAMQHAQTGLAVARSGEEQAQQTLALLREGPRSETIRAQESVVEQGHAQVALAEATLAHTVVTAPFDGVITVRHREPGETVGAGSPVVTLLNPSDRWVRIYVREDVIGRVQIGQAAEIRSDSYPDRAYTGEVTFVGSEAEFTPRNVQTTEARTKLVYPVKIRITGDPNFELKPGIPADVTIVENRP